MIPKYVKRAGQWCVTEISTDPKTKNRKQTIHWFHSKNEAGDYLRTIHEKENQKTETT